MLLQRSLRVVTRTSFVKARQSHSQGRVFACQLHVDVIDVADSRSKSVSEISELLQQELRGTHKTGPPVLQLERQRFDDLPPPLYARHGSETRAILAMSDAQDATQQRNFRKTLAALSKEAEPSHTVSVVGNLREAGDFLEDALVGNSQQKHTCTIRYLGVSVQPQLTVVCGPMFAGKTNRLVDFYEQAASALCANVALGATSQPLKIQVLKPALDNRDAANVVRTHDGRVIDHAISYQSLDFERDFCECGDATRNPVVRSDCPDVFIIDEAHFFDDVQLTKFLDAVRRLRPTAAVCVAGLDHDYRQLPFPTVAAALAFPHAHIERLVARCQYFDGIVEADSAAHYEGATTSANQEDFCNADAEFSARRISVSGATLLVGGSESYLPVCRCCYDKYHEPRDDDRV